MDCVANYWGDNRGSINYKYRFVKAISQIIYLQLKPFATQIDRKKIRGHNISETLHPPDRTALILIVS
jgi:hypothetical protein